MHQLSRLSTKIHFRSNWLTCPVWLSLWETFLQVPTIADEHPKRGLPWDFPILGLCRHKYVTCFVSETGVGSRPYRPLPGLLEYLGVSEARWTISNRCGLGEVARPQREPNWTQQQSAVSRMGYGLARYNTHVNDRWVKEAG